jgi:hypothetical protein
MKSTWGSDLYGNPCRECGFSWSITLNEGVTLVTDMSVEYRSSLMGATGKEQHPRLSWSVAAYVCHVADNLRIWAERLAGIAAGGPPEVGLYDDNLLAQARQYEMVPLEAALWSLEQSIASWQLGVEQAAAADVVLVHPEYGEQTVDEVVRSNAHDTAHHLWDIRRSRVTGSGSTP